MKGYGHLKNQKQQQQAYHRWNVAPSSGIAGGGQQTVFFNPSNTSGSNFHHQQSHLGRSFSAIGQGQPRKNAGQTWKNAGGRGGGQGGRSLVNSSGCEYIFTEGKLLPIVECADHQQLPKLQQQQHKQQSQKRPSPPGLSETVVNHQFSQASVGQVAWSTALKAAQNNNSKTATTKQQETRCSPPAIIPIPPPPPPPQVTNPHPYHQQVIHYPVDKSDMKKFIEASIVFGSHNVIDIIDISSSSGAKGGPVKPLKVDFTTSVSKPVDGTFTSTALPTTAVGNQQTAKKVRCLIANFITLEVEQQHSSSENEDKELAEENLKEKELPANDETFPEEQEEVDNLEDYENHLLASVDSEKLGFQNFDGKNIGLYKNIGYINRNRAQFVQPTQALLQLMVSLSKQLSKTTAANDIKEKVEEKEVMVMEGSEEESAALSILEVVSPQLNLSQFYDHVNPTSYSKENVYSVKEVIIANQGSDQNLYRPKPNKGAKNQMVEGMEQRNQARGEGADDLPEVTSTSTSSPSSEVEVATVGYKLLSSSSSSGQLQRLVIVDDDDAADLSPLFDDHWSSSIRRSSRYLTGTDNKVEEDEEKENSPSLITSTSTNTSFYITEVVFGAN